MRFLVTGLWNSDCAAPGAGKNEIFMSASGSSRGFKTDLVTGSATEALSQSVALPGLNGHRALWVRFLDGGRAKVAVASGEHKSIRCANLAVEHATLRGACLCFRLGLARTFFALLLLYLVQYSQFSLGGYYPFCTLYSVRITKYLKRLGTHC